MNKNNISEKNALISDKILKIIFSIRNANQRHALLKNILHYEKIIIKQTNFYNSKKHNNFKSKVRGISKAKKGLIKKGLLKEPKHVRS